MTIKFFDSIEDHVPGKPAAPAQRGLSSAIGLAIGALVGALVLGATVGAMVGACVVTYRVVVRLGPG